jgi:hypothetical protein
MWSDNLCTTESYYTKLIRKQVSGMCEPPHNCIDLKVSTKEYEVQSYAHAARSLPISLRTLGLNLANHPSCGSEANPAGFRKTMCDPLSKSLLRFLDQIPSGPRRVCRREVGPRNPKDPKPTPTTTGPRHHLRPESWLLTPPPSSSSPPSVLLARK